MSWAGLAVAVLSACGGGGEEQSTATPELPWDPGTWPAYEAPDERQADLGKLLFYDPLLGADGTTACATCHSEHWGMSDGLPVSVGLDGVGAVGPGRVGPNHTRRNSMSLWNVAFRERLFWDGRTETLEEQVSAPLTAAEELGSSEAGVVAALRANAEYSALFAEAFPGEALDFGQVARALAAFQRVLVSDWAPYDRYAKGDLGALSEQSKRGMEAFAEQGCVSCHVPPRFELELYADRGQVNADGVADEGRFEVSNDPADRGAFRVPTLRNLRDSEPYFHAGTAPTVEDAVRSELAFSAGIAPSAVADDLVDDITHFLIKGLTDRTRQQPRPARLPSGFPVPLDNFRIPR
ncbi:MAG: cytochrome-c peroxidase [Myxococcales bacterium]|nr:cytochrome-c peroxidase [Myxococcales bacterium]